MVSKKSIYHGPRDDFQSSVIPKAPRSLRKSPHKRSSDGSKLCAFELLAAVADKLLQESESSTSSIGQEPKEQATFPIVKREDIEVKVNDVKSNHFDHGSSTESESNLTLKLDPPLKSSPESGNDSGLEHVSEVRIVNSVNVDLPLYKNPVSCFSKHRGNVKTGITDDDDNSFRPDCRGARMRAFRSRSRSQAGYRRIRKMLTSRYRKVTLTKDYELTNPTSQIEAAYKRRKLFHHRPKSSYENKKNKVKFSINSFKVPELYIEIPENATIGSLKRLVMEAIRTYLGGKLRVGMTLEGKKVKDNNRTLKQIGISVNRDLDTLGFTLEPSLPNDISREPSSCTAGPVLDVGFSNGSLDHPPETSLELDKCVDKNHEIVPLETEILTEEKAADSNALVLAVPINYKPIKKSEVTQCRRIRRPFSVTEVEALVEAVETLGTGRWRDVKLRAFDGADHRTYVDLKDKWKTLVHTANISPQQRRGEPVPQDLLDRVLAAHGYWSNHKVKQLKHKTEPLGILGGSSVEFVGI
ncbi:putative transcription factor MYB-HB-like family [Helianthus annuus]|uniref:Putative homeodomain-like, Ubiquitin-related domain protein n=1 Tax=Helianthus annuus TaxID=4232 RepID=A0A251TV81_HELAN|nr:telomere repeat-binding protein 3 [Helianthus annuus]KAF5790271.1 putative SANT/Myb domain, Homeobox-like domain superfamily, Ubiquitin-like domain superfamily [Helianthus annuus]KAJ0752914.1 putative transcription factor MYB-HB-like family [Helianthus annuus]